MLEIGTKIFLQLITEAEDEKEIKTYRCRVIDRSDNESILVDYPVDKETGKQALLIDETPFLASFIGSGDALYQFDTTLIERVRKKIPMLKFSDPGKKNYRRIQRRDYVRVNTIIQVEVQSLKEDYKSFRTVMLDISGGGCRIVLPARTNFPNEGECILTFALPIQSDEDVELEIKSKIIRTENQEQSEHENVSFKFLDITEKQRQQIVQYCFERQLKLRRTKD